MITAKLGTNYPKRYHCSAGQRMCQLSRRVGVLVALNRQPTLLFFVKHEKQKDTKFTFKLTTVQAMNATVFNFHAKLSNINNLFFLISVGMKINGVWGVI
jgi:hypothetical protein